MPSIRPNKKCLAWIGVLILAVLLSSGCSGIVGRSKGAGNPPRVPFGLPHLWLLAFIDVETTGLIPGYHEMIDIGVVMADLEGNEIDRFFVRILPDHPERVTNKVVEINGFSVERWEASGAVSKEEAVRLLIDFYVDSAEGRNVLMVAYNASFDAAFLDHLFRSAGRGQVQLHKYVLDLPSMAWGAGIRGVYGRNVRDFLGVKDEPRAPAAEPWEHTGLTGALQNARIYRALQEYLKQSR